MPRTTLRRAGLVLVPLLLVACKSRRREAAAPSPTATAAETGANLRGAVTDAELTAAVTAAGCHDLHREGRLVRMQCKDTARSVDLTNLDLQLDTPLTRAERVARIQTFLRLGDLDAAAHDASSELPRDSILPMLKSRQVIDATLARIPPEMRDRVTIPVRPLAGNVVMVLGIDRPDTIETITSQHLARWKTDAGDLADLAVQNLTRKASPAPTDAGEGRVKMVLVNSGDSYDAARILVPETRIRVEEALGGAAVYAVPDRDHLFAVRADDDAALAALAARAKALSHGTPYAISDDLLRYEDGRWTVVKAP